MKSTHYESTSVTCAIFILDIFFSKKRKHVTQDIATVKNETSRKKKKVEEKGKEK